MYLADSSGFIFDESKTLIEIDRCGFISKSITTYRNDDMILAFETEIFNNEDIICNIITYISMNYITLEIQFMSDYEDHMLYELLHSLRSKMFRVNLNFINNKIKIEDVFIMHEDSWLCNDNLNPSFVFSCKNIYQNDEFKSLLHKLADLDIKNAEYEIKLLLIN